MIKHRKGKWFIQCDVSGCASTFTPSTGYEYDPKILRALAKVDGWHSSGNERLRIFDVCLKHPSSTSLSTLVLN